MAGKYPIGGGISIQTDGNRCSLFVSSAFCIGLIHSERVRIIVRHRVPFIPIVEGQNVFALR